SEPDDLATCAKLAQQWGYDEVNLNCGCPSDRVQRGAFGACLMAEADLVAEYGDALPAFQLSDEPAEDSFAVVESADQGTETADEPAEPIKEEAPAVVFAAAGAHRDDLKIVEGIGPKIEELLFQNGVYTYQQLAETPVEDIRTILNNAGSRFAMHDPGTWSAQALLAANGEWDNLKAYQDFLNAGKRPGA
ncbi:MAG TPA: tRNA-dihydrouridine synthase, partial [Saprospiraceae bacterium]|nr:tRNA-dihydrouridine synthase [Saprospiraceae bacterium]